MNKKIFSYGLLVGAAVGAVSALLTTPSSGRDLREQLQHSAEEWLEMVKDMKVNVVNLKDSVAKLSAEGKETILQLTSDIKEIVQQWQMESKPIKEQLDKEIAEIQRTIEELESEIRSEDKTEQ
ncbi:YtxH domain-containing protein [Falsibacillus pallidus]|uniref:Gas vesicle protein n=1 Tax=Falsibacillus pallidus TaxID=493781 RepID=A0A370GWE4_9BACI|nr:YtxH domain-containing protein [Falsibacillus pallidus]RDI47871.1 gas vesicle protein [Falsibacillus pallidus]